MRAALLLVVLAGCATPPAPVAHLPEREPEPPVCERGPTVLFGHEIDPGRTQIVLCKWDAEEKSLLCLPSQRKERTL